jgi:hypothetical protein
MRRFLRGLVVGVTAVAAGLIGPGVAGASIEGQLMTWSNAHTGECLGVAGGNMANGTAVIVWPCNGNPDQKWTAEPTGFGDVLLRNSVPPHKCISVAAKSTANQARLVIFDCKRDDDNQDQRWIVGGSRWPGTTVFTNFNSELAMGLRTNWPLPGPQTVQEGPQLLTDMLWFGTAV